MRTTDGARPAHYPAMLDLAGRDVLLVGGGAVAARKADAVLDAGARLRVVAPALSPAVRRLVEQRQVRWQPRAVRPEDVDGCALVICAAASREANAAAATRARGLGIPVVVCDDPRAGTAIVPASLRRGRVVVSVSTGGASPALAAFVRRQLEGVIGEEYGALCDLSEELRTRLRAAGAAADERERAVAGALPGLLELLRQGRAHEAAALVDELAPAAEEAAAWS